MKELVNLYLDKNYRVVAHFFIYNKNTSRFDNSGSIVAELQVIFELNQIDTIIYFEEWYGKKFFAY